MFSSTEARLLLQLVVGLDNMLAAYMVEYGDELAKTLTQGDDVVEGEVVDDENQETFGFDSEDGRLDASEEE